MTYLLGAIFGVAGSILWQLLEIKEFRRKRRCWPWQDDRNGLDVSFFIYQAIVKLIAAAVVVALLVYTNQISGPWAAAAAGMVADSIVIKAASSAKRGYSKL